MMGHLQNICVKGIHALLKQYPLTGFINIPCHQNLCSLNIYFHHKTVNVFILIPGNHFPVFTFRLPGGPQYFNRISFIQLYLLSLAEINDILRLKTCISEDFLLHQPVCIIYIQLLHHSLPGKFANSLVMIRMQMSYKGAIHLTHPVFQKIGS